MSVRIETDGRVTVFAGADKRPIASAPAAPVPPAAPPAKAAAEPALPPGALRAGFENFAGVLAWIDALGASGLDGHDLRELGLKNGNLIVDDRRNGKRWTFDRINASLQRPAQGGVIFRLESDNPKRAWALSAAMRPLADGVRAVGIEARQVAMRDILLALRIKEDDVDADLPLSASIRAEIAADGTPRVVQGQVLVGSGTISDNEDGKRVSRSVDHANIRFMWDAGRHTLVVPFQVQAGGNQFTLRASVEAPSGDSGLWQIAVTRGDNVIDPVIIAAPAKSNEEGISLNRRRHPGAHRHRAQAHRSRSGRHRPRRHAADLQCRPGGDRQPRLFAARSASRLRRRRHPHADLGDEAAVADLSPPSHVRGWVEQHVSGGTIERIVIAGNAPLSSFEQNGPPTPDEGLVGRHGDQRHHAAADSRPAGDPRCRSHRSHHRPHHHRQSRPRHGRGRARAQAQHRQRAVRRSRIRTPQARLLAYPRSASTARCRRRPSCWRATRCAATVGLALDPATSRGTVAAQVALELPLDQHPGRRSSATPSPPTLPISPPTRCCSGRRWKPPSMQVTATNAGYQVKGDVKINGTPATIDLRQTEGRARRRSAFAGQARRGRARGGSASISALPSPASSRSRSPGASAATSRTTASVVDADLTPVARSTTCCRAGRSRPASRRTRRHADQERQIDALRGSGDIDGSGVNVKGMVEVDNAGDVSIGQFPGLRAVGRRQGFAQGRPRQRRRAARDHARRRL